MHPDALSDAFACIIEQAVEPMLVTCVDGVLLLANAAARALLGWPAKGPCGRPLGEVLGLNLVLAHALEVPALLRRSDGSSFPASLRVAAWSAGAQARGFTVGLRELSALDEIQARLRAAESRYAHLLAMVPEGILLQDARGGVRACNDRAQEFLGISPRSPTPWASDCMLREDGSAMPQDEWPPLLVLRTGIPVRGVTLGVRQGERLVRWLQVSSAPLWDGDGVGPEAVITVLVDVSARLACEAVLRKRGDWFAAAANASLDSVYILGSIRDGAGVLVDFRPVFINRNAADRLGTPPDALAGASMRRYAEQSPSMAQIFDICREVVETGVPQVMESSGMSPGTAKRWMSRAISRVDDGVLVTSRDMTDRKRYEDALRKLVHVDTLTGLPNRRMFLDLLEKSCQRMRRRGGGVALLFVDLDDLKGVNDRLGHAAGDELLRAFGHALRAAVRATDSVARLAGDEFTVLLEDLHGPEEAESVVEKLLAVLESPACIHGHEVPLSASVGMAYRSAAEADPDELLASADEAMYRVKRRRRAARLRA